MCFQQCMLPKMSFNIMSQASDIPNFFFSGCGWPRQRNWLLDLSSKLNMYQAQPLQKDGADTKNIHAKQFSQLYSRVVCLWACKVKSKQQIRKWQAATTSHGTFCLIKVHKIWPKEFVERKWQIDYVLPPQKQQTRIQYAQSLLWDMVPNHGNTCRILQ